LIRYKNGYRKVTKIKKIHTKLLRDILIGAIAADGAGPSQAAAKVQGNHKKGPSIGIFHTL
jgi:hypothetical protein